VEEGADVLAVFCWGKECRGEGSSQMARDDQQSCNATKTLTYELTLKVLQRHVQAA